MAVVACGAVSPGPHPQIIPFLDESAPVPASYVPRTRSGIPGCRRRRGLPRSPHRRSWTPWLTVSVGGHVGSSGPDRLPPAKISAVVRKGPFWDAVEGRVPLPPAAVTLGWELLAADPDIGTIEVAFNATEAFLNPVGVIQGGFLAAMLDDTLGPALVCGLNAGDFAPTTDLHVQFLRPARPGRLIGHGRVVRRGRDIAFLAGELLDDEGSVVAVATSTVQIRASMLSGDPATNS